MEYLFIEMVALTEFARSMVRSDHLLVVAWHPNGCREAQIWWALSCCCANVSKITFAAPSR
jgi:hypothetical protein